MKIAILGNSSAIPAYGRFPTSQLVQVHQHHLLLDCGEGTQMKLQQYGLRAGQIDHIFISHAHGDHFFGLAPLVSSQSLLGRSRPLYIYGPPEVKQIIDLQLFWPLGFELIYRVLEEGERALLWQDDKTEIRCFPVMHSVPTHGFRITECHRKRKLIPEKLREFEIPKYYYAKLSDGFDYESKDGRIIINDWVSEEGVPSAHYVYTADTCYHEGLLDDIAGADILYHESTYLQSDIQKAHERMHATSIEAATMALKSKAKKLIIGHFSSRYKDLQPFLDEAISVFPNTVLALEGVIFNTGLG